MLGVKYRFQGTFYCPKSSKKCVCTLSRRSDTGFGIWDLARKLATKAKFGAFGQNRDFFGTILGPFWDFVVILMILPQNNTED